MDKVFNFMKKDKGEHKEEKKKKSERKDSKKSSSSSRDRERLSAEDLHHLDEVRRSLKIRSRRKEKEKLPSGIIADYSANFTSVLAQDQSNGDVTANGGNSITYGNRTLFRPPLPPKPPQRGILKVRTDDQQPPVPAYLLPDPSPPLPSTASSSSLTPSFATPPLSPSPPTRVAQRLELEIPQLEGSPYNRLLDISSPCLPSPVTVTLNRLPTGDFGFTLRRVTLGGNRWILYAEPSNSTFVGNNTTGLMPGDRLVQIGDRSVEGRSREEVIDIIKTSGDTLTLQVEPAPELSEVSAWCLGHARGDGKVTGIIRRTPSHRLKRSQQAKSEEELASDRAWLTSERVWVVHRGGFTGGQLLSTSNASSPTLQTNGDSFDGKLTIRIDATGDVLKVDDEDVEKANPIQYDKCENLSQLPFLNESSVLNCLHKRYISGLIHTNAGPSMVVINPCVPLASYSENIMNVYRGHHWEEVPPHIYSVAQSCYRSMLTTRQDQSIAFLGRSGGGKTNNFRHTLMYLAHVAGGNNKVVTGDKLNACFTLLESFGNSGTVINSNATRFSQIFSLDFDHAGQVAGASVQLLLVDKWWLVHRPEGEPTFGIMYQLLAGAQGPLRKDLLFEGDDKCMFMTPLQRTEERQKACSAFVRVVSAMTILGVKDHEAKALWSVLAALYHLGVAGVTKGRGGRSHFASPAHAQKAATLLGINVEELSRSIFQSPNNLSPQHGLTEEYTKNTIEGIAALEATLVGMYNEVLAVVASLINRSLSSSSSRIGSILLVDTPGLQTPPSGHLGTFQDLCHNYVQERLQALCHHVTCTHPIERYAQEQIECDLDELQSSIPSQPNPLLAVLDRPPQTPTLVRPSLSPSHQSEVRDTDRRGLFFLLDEEIGSSTSDEALVEKFITLHSDRDYQGVLVKGNNPRSFALGHLNRTCTVIYSATNWIKQAQESPLTKRAATILHESQHDHISILFTSLRGPMCSSMMNGSFCGLETGNNYQTLRRVSSVRRTFTLGGTKRRSTAIQIKAQTDGLIETLRRSNPRFVHCFMPTPTAGLCEAQSHNGIRTTNISIPLLRDQLRGSQLLQTLRVHKQGFSDSLMLSEFKRTFTPLVNDLGLSNGSIDDKEAVKAMVRHLEEEGGIDRGGIRIGLSQVFLRPGVLSLLESQRDMLMSDLVIRFQSCARGFVARKKHEQRKVQELAVCCIQRNVRKFLLVRDWPWWRLLVRVTPLLNVNRMEQELREKTEELESLRIKLEKLEKERSQLSQENERLDAKVSELSADLSEEQASCVLTEERLGAESTERRRMEQEMLDLKSHFESSQQHHERLESELLLRRAADVNGVDGGSEDEEGDSSVLRQKYERVCKEVGFLRNQFSQQKEDHVEQLMTQRKQMERKVIDAYEECEEQRQVVAQWKRKCTKSTSELNDLRLLLEEQMTRNALLEKKQRKFDSELQLLQEQVKLEKNQRDAAIREKDMIQGDIYAAELTLSSLKLELELKEEKLNCLSRELEELTFGCKTEEDIAALKRQKHDLELRLKDQEEELDDMAGQVGMLEQGKLRLEMLVEQMRKEHRRDIQQKEEEVEDVRAGAQKKVKVLEAQLENEHEERTQMFRDKHELERRIADLQEQSARFVDQDAVPRLKKELRRTKALLRDAQTMLERMKNETPSKSVLRQLKNQLEDAEFSRSAAVKARQNLERELDETQCTLEECQRGKCDIEEKLLTVQRERGEVQVQLEESEEEVAQVMKRYKAAVQQLSVDQITIQEQSAQVVELESQRNALREQLAEMSTKLEVLEGDSVSSAHQKRLELKVRELESRLELENTTKTRLETQINRLKENVDRLHSECQTVRAKEQSALENNRRLQRQLRETREELTACQQKESSSVQRCSMLEKRLETSDAELSSARSDLKLALERVEDLQAAMQGGSDDSDINSDGESSSDDEMYVSGHDVYSKGNFLDLESKSEEDGLPSGRLSPVGGLSNAEYKPESSNTKPQSVTFKHESFA